MSDEFEKLLAKLGDSNNPRGYAPDHARAILQRHMLEARENVGRVVESTMIAITKHGESAPLDLLSALALTPEGNVNDALRNALQSIATAPEGNPATPQGGFAHHYRADAAKALKRMGATTEVPDDVTSFGGKYLTGGDDPRSPTSVRKGPLGPQLGGGRIR